MGAIRYIANYPGLGPELLTPVRDLHRVPRWLPRERTTLVPGGRNALYFGCKAMRLGPGDAILAPAFVCDTVSRPLLKAGARLAFFTVNRDLSIDWDHVRDVLAAPRWHKRIKAMLWYHYLGLSAGFDEVIPFCREHGLYLIEDCAHALFSRYKGRPVGVTGDFAAFSVHKTLPVPRAGALVINNAKLARRVRLPKPVTTDADVRMFSEMENLYYRLHFLAQNPTRPIARRNAWPLQQRQAKLYKNLERIHEIDDTSLLVMHNTVPDAVRQARHRNFDLYLKRLGGLCPFRRCTPGASPIGFPILVEQRDEFRKRLKERHGVDALTHWPIWLLPKGVKERFPDAVFLGERVLTLPCHHDLGPADIEYAARSVLQTL